MESESAWGKNEAKVFAMIMLGVGSIGFGLLPAWISSRNRQRYPMIISGLLCFGAGVLLATALVHMFAEVKEALPNYAEIIFCIGFFIVYFVDEIVHFLLTNNHRSHLHSSDSSTISSSNLVDQSVSGYGAISQPNHGHPCTEAGTSKEDVLEVAYTHAPANNLTGKLSLLFALSLHSLLEGLAIGVQDTGTKVTLIVTAVACHKFVVGFCLGIELCETRNTTFRLHVLSITVFSLGSVVGIVLGILIVDISSASNATVALFQGLAAGTLMYVTVCEVLPREKSRRHENRNMAHRFAGLIQFSAVIVGFTIMTVLYFYLGD